MGKIPKKIHYIWLGRGEKPELAKKCIESWKKNLPDYEIIEWNEDNFDINQNQYLKEAYENKKYAFASDYIRVYVLYNQGGIYMDTDVEVLKPLDEFLDLPAFSGFESNNNIPTGLMAASKGNKWMKLLLDDYDDLKFVKEDGSLDLTTNVVRITEVTEKNYKFIRQSSYQDLKDVVFFPSDYFCPKNCVTGVIELTENTYTIHHFNGSWLPKSEKKFITERRKFVSKYGEVEGIKRHERKLKILNSWRYLLWPIKAIIKPKRAIEKVKEFLKKGDK